MINDREQFKRYILTSLGAPVIKVNVTDNQLEDRIDDALDMWHQYHNEGSMRTFLKQMITPSVLKVESGDTSTIDPHQSIEGLSSGAKADVTCLLDNVKNSHGQIMCYNVEGQFIPGEKIAVGAKNDKTHKIFKLKDSEDFFTKGIYDEQRIKVPSWVHGVTRILPANTATSSQNLFDAQYQLRLSDIYDLTSTSLIYYEQAMEHLDLLNFELSANPNFEFNRHEGYIYPICKWGIDFVVGQYMIIDCYRALDPRKAPLLWNDIWLKKYATALVKRQWGLNLSKFQNIQLAGGVSLNGDAIYQEAKQDIQTLEEQLMMMIPPSAFFIG